MATSSPAWLLLIISLPSSSATVRMRIWRAVKALGCVALRDGACLLPTHAGQAAALRELADEAAREGGQAWLLQTHAQDDDESAALQLLFERSVEYAQWLGELAHVRETLAERSGPDLARLLRRHERAYGAIRRIDFFPSEASTRAQARWRDFVGAVEAILSPGEPHATAGSIPRRDPMHYQGRVWATRRHLWVDRVACAWLIRRFIDPAARFLWLDDPADCPADALGFDFDGAAFTHVGDRVSFQVLVAGFGLDENRALVRLGALVHGLDVGGAAAAEAGGFEAILAGARKRVPDDDALLNEMTGVLDSLYAHFTGARQP